MKKRNNNIDFLRGIATLCIILIHTAFWTGEMYLPAWFKNLTLLVDVPVFMYISGISFSYVNSVSKNIVSLIKQWKKWIFFILIYTLLILIFKNEQFAIKDFICWLAYYFPNDTFFIVVQGSIWFWVMYIKVTIIGSIIICINNYLEKNKEKNKRNLIYILLLVTLIFMYTTLSGINEFIFDSKTWMFILIYLFGYLTVNYKIDLKKTLLYETIIILTTFILFFGFGYKITNIQTLKFEFSMVYLPFAFISIVLFWYLKDSLKIKENNPINYIGKNAIWFYFAQGISSSLLFSIYPYVKNHRDIIVFSIMLFINILLSSIIAYVLEKTYNYVEKIEASDKIKKLVKNISPQAINSK